MLTLYDYELSGNCYKPRLLLALLGVEYRHHPVDFYPGREHRSEAFLERNPLGQLPFLQDGDVALRDAQAILVYLASRYDASGTWYPRDVPELLGEITQWLLFADALTVTAGAARLHDVMFHEVDVERCRCEAHRLLRVLDEHLWFAERGAAGWVCSPPHPTIADLAVFPYAVLAEEGGISCRDYPAVRRWTDRIKALPGFVPMPGIYVLPPVSATETAPPTRAPST